MRTPIMKPATSIPVARGTAIRNRRTPRERIWRVIESGLARDTPAQDESGAPARTGELVRDLAGRLLRAQDEERRRIARDLHDSTCQTLLAASLTLNQLQAHVAEGGAAPFASVQSALADSMRELRTLSYLLHPPLLEECGLVVALREFLRGFAQRSGIAVEIRLAHEIGRLPHEIETILFRIVQEGITNVHRHSGSKMARVRLLRLGDRVALSVSDRGRGMSPSGGNRAAPMGVGIAGMRARVQQFGGQLRIRSGRGGTVVRATVTLAEPPRAVIALERRHEPSLPPHSESDAGGRLRR